MWILELFKPFQASSLIAPAQIVQTHKHWVIATINNLVLDNDATPVSIALWTLVVFVVQITGSSYKSMLTLASNKS
jgi:hypothetical protein